ncbi:hypothetical protein IJG91_00520 [Candidatus Saccharibacteria bacterium]|nr:hypothetical protein [Candidatus Saccharibacteria bacterium]
MGEEKVLKDKTAKKKLSKKALILIIVGGLVFILAIVAVVLCIFVKPWESSQGKSDSKPVASIERVDGADYEQKITTADGAEFTPKITEGTSDNLTMRFTELSCDDDCKNVENVTVDGKNLKLGEDYEVKKGSVVLVIYAKVFSDKQPGEMKVKFEITEDSKILTIGVKITIEKKEEKKDELSDNTQNNQQATSGNSSASNTSGGSSNGQNVVDAAKVACEARTDGPISVTTYHFLSAAERKEWTTTYAPGYPEDEVYALYTWFSGSPAPMHYINGTCLPSISSASDWIGVGAQPISKAQLQQRGITRTQDFVRWTYADGRVEDQITTDFNSFWRW